MTSQLYMGTSPRYIEFPRRMSEGSLIPRLRERRSLLGWSQAQLAEQVGVSRQALGAIEAGRQVPSTLLALQLARALTCAVDDLFKLPGDGQVRAQLAHPAPRGSRVLLARVDAQLIAHPLTKPDRSADGLLTTEAKPGEWAEITPVGDDRSFDRHLLIAGCAPLLGLLADRFNRSQARARATWVPANSSRALELLAAGHVHLAGIHLAHANNRRAHHRAARRILPEQNKALVHLAGWRQGLVFGREHAGELRADSGLLRPDLRFIRRDKGSAAQMLFDRVLREAGAQPPRRRPKAPVARDHQELARMVRWGVGDVGVAVESVALAEGLDFFPLSEEQFDLVLPESRLDHPEVGRFLDLVSHASFRNEAAALPGYDLSNAGQVISVEAQ